MKDRWRKEIRNSIALLDGVQIEQLSFHREDNENFLMRLSEFIGTIEPESDTAVLEFALEPGVSIVGHQHVGKLRSHVELSPDTLVLSGRGNLKEGQYNTKLKWDVNSGFWAADLKMQDMPASHFVSLLEEWKVVSWPDLNLKNQWFRCNLRSEGSLISWEEAPAHFDSCGFYGEQGDIHIRAGESQLFKSNIYPIVADFRNVSVGPLLLQFGQLRHLVRSEGRTSGELTITEGGELNYKGIWRNPQFHLPSLAIFKPNTINFDQLSLSWTYNDKRSIVELSSPTAYGEDFPLEVSLTEELGSKDYRVRWLADWEHWHKAMTKRFEGLSASRFQSKGELLISTQVELDVNISAENVILDKTETESLKASARYSDGKGEFSADAKTVTLKESLSAQFFLSVLKLTQLENPLPTDIQLSGEFDQHGRWVVNPLKLKGAEFVGRGYKTSVDQGVLKITSGQSEVKKYNVFGSLEEPRFEVH
jgi:hypothetical protein